MRKIILSLDIIDGPIIKDYINPQTSKLETRIRIIDEDKVVQKLDEEIQDMYSSYYEYNSHDQACWFNAEKELEEAPLILKLLEQLKARLDEINDGSYEVEDLLTWRYEELLEKNGMR